MELVSDSLPEKFAACYVEQVGAACIYYVQDGRNAWHSTWVRRYYSDTFHLSLFAAQRAAEVLRVQGSVFRLVTLPVVHFKTSSASLLVSELHVQCPLLHFRPALSRERADRRARACSPYFTNYVLPRQLERSLNWEYPRVGDSLGEVHQAFAANSVNWAHPENRRSVVSFLLKPSDNVPTKLPRKKKLADLQSYSIGTDFHLRWSDVDGKKQSACWRVASKASTPRLEAAQAAAA